jgi:POT family proton-dependent oligopeptide transporter
MATTSAPTSAAAGAIDHPGQLNERPDLGRRRGHPPGLTLLFLAEMWERFSFYGMRALLVLYLVNALKWRPADASNLYGTYTAAVYLTPLLGGWIADRFIGTARSLVVGGVIIALGHFTLAFAPESAGAGGVYPVGGSMAAFYAGLALVVVGTGFFKPNVSTMVGQLYRAGDERRDAGFTVFYMGINLGAFLAPLVCGYLGESPRFGWHYGFGAAGVGMVLGLLTFVWGRNRYLEGIGLPPARAGAHHASSQRGADYTAGDVAEGAVLQAEVGAAQQVATTPLPGIIAGLAGAVLGYVAGGLLGFFMGGIILWALATTVLGTRGEERNRVLAIFVVVFFVIFFWAAYEQAGSSMNLFADKNTDLTAPGWMRGLAGGDRIPASWFQSVNPLVLLASAPLFAMLWPRLARAGREPSTAMKMVWGLALLGVGFVFMVLGARASAGGALVSPWWLVAAYAFHTWGELCLSPVGLSYVTKVAPLQFASLMMGVWFLANAAANKVAGTLAAQVEAWGNTTLFTVLVASSLAAAALMLLSVPLLKRLTRTVRA